MLQLLGVCLAAGLLVAGASLPVIGGAGLVAKSSADSFSDLPSELRITPLKQRSQVLAADGSVLAYFYAHDRREVKLTQVAESMRKAVVAIEDSRFYRHNGVDFEGTGRAMVENFKAGAVVQGGSTLTQQYVKNVLLNSAKTPAEIEAATAKDPVRKLREARFAMALEQRLTKDQILERYLNIAYFGSSAYGIETASRRFFSVPASRLNLQQSAMLAGLVRNPRDYDPTRQPQQALARRNLVLNRMLATGAITPQQHAAAVKSPLGLKISKTNNGCDAASAPFFCDLVVREIKKNPAFGKTPDERRALLNSGGLTIRTSLDRKAQTAAQEAMDSTVPRHEEEAAVINMVEPGTGRIKAMAVNRNMGADNPKRRPGDPRATRLNLAIGEQTGVQSGSTFKVFTLAAALQQGLPLSLAINSPNRYMSTAFPSANPFPYPVRNAADSENGVFDMREATELSVNTYYIQLLERVGVDRVRDLATAMGIRDLSDNDGEVGINSNPSITLGTEEISPLDLAAAYAVFPAQGTYCAPHAIVAVTDPAGRKYAAGAPRCKKVLDEGVANTVTEVLTGVIERGTAQRNGQIGRPAAGKTGTAQEYRAALFAGYTPQLSAAVWMGDPRGAAKHKLRNVTVNGELDARVFGGDFPTEIWAKAMRGAHDGVPVKDFPQPEADIMHGDVVNVPDVDGLSVGAARSILEQRGFTPVMRIKPVYDSAPDGRVAYTDPGAGAGLPQGNAVYIHVSNGQPVSPPPALTVPKPKPKPSAAAPPRQSPPKPGKPEKAPKPG